MTCGEVDSDQLHFPRSPGWEKRKQVGVGVVSQRLPSVVGGGWVEALPKWVLIRTHSSEGN